MALTASARLRRARLDGVASSPFTPAEQIRTDMSPTRSSSSRQTDDDLAARAREWAERTAIQQGLPVKIDNPLILKKVAEILWPQDKKGDQT
jgi:hypothetical protein